MRGASVVYEGRVSARGRFSSDAAPPTWKALLAETPASCLVPTYALISDSRSPT